MDPARLIQQLDDDRAVLPGLFAGLTEEQARWRPVEDRWSILEVARHLLDEEREDFRVRIGLTLEDPTQEWPSIDPAGWVQARGYNTADLAATVEDFLAERAKSLEWLRGLGDVDWSLAYQHPSFGPVKAGDLLSSWVTHDWFHVRQVGRLRVEQISGSVAPFSTTYVDP